MTVLNRLLRTPTEEQTDPLRFRPEAEVLEAREVPSATLLTLQKSADAPCYTPGAPATYTYVATNTGVFALNLVSLSDDNGGYPSPFTLHPGVDVVAVDNNGTANTSDDFVVTANTNLEVGHSWTFSHTVTIPNVPDGTSITNTATVKGTTVMPNPEEQGVELTATATATVCVCLPGTPLSHGDTATIGFWNNKNGQALINSLNGGPNSPALATWLATNFPALYGAQAGANNLTGKTNADVAALFKKFFAVKGMNTDAQIMSAALASYATDSDLAGTVATKYGFHVSAGGTGEKVFNVGSNGQLIGLQNNTSFTVFQLLQQANIDKLNGTFNAGAFNSIFDGINQKGDII